MVTAMTTKLIKPSLAAAVVVLTPMVAFAHTGVGDTSGFVRGFGLRWTPIMRQPEPSFKV